MNTQNFEDWKKAQSESEAGSAKLALIFMALMFAAALLASCSNKAGHTDHRQQVSIEVPKMLMDKAEANYNAAITACTIGEGSDGAICDTMGVYGFDLEGDPFRIVSQFEKIDALNYTQR